jgi:hypothetical protein
VEAPPQPTALRARRRQGLRSPLHIDADSVLQETLAAIFAQVSEICRATNLSSALSSPASHPPHPLMPASRLSPDKISLYY